MRKALILFFALILTLGLTACVHAETVKVMTSFYPMYIFALNVFDGIDAIELDCMTCMIISCWWGI